MNIYIVTPSYNSAETIKRTILSVISQSGNFSIYYHIQDGGSTDGTLDILECWAKLFEHKLIPICCSNIKFSYSAEPDKGMYDAIQKGFSRFDFNDIDWITWINADDIILPYACSLMCNIDRDDGLKSKVNWVTGQPAIINNGSPVKCKERMLNSDIISAGFADGISAQFVQQEGTFFRGLLWKKHNEKALSKFMYAGDWSLWKHFAVDEKLYYAEMPLGVFTSRSDQISKRFWHKYMLEILENNTYSERGSYCDRYLSIFARSHDGELFLSESSTNIKIEGEKTIALYSDLRRLLKMPQIAIKLNFERLFVYGYNAFARHIFNMIKSGGASPNAYIVSEERFCDANEPLALTIADASPSEKDLVVVASFRNVNTKNILSLYNMDSAVINWTELLPKEE